MTPRRRTAGTTLLEVLVVIVIFLVGILAVVQIFPKGLNILVLSRSSSMAAALARDEVERLKAHADELPDAIVPVMADGLTVDTSRSPNDLGPSGNSLSALGILSGPGGTVGDWMLHAGANNFRRVEGESRRITAPRQVGAGAGMYGSLMILQFGPVEFVPETSTTPSNLAVYGNDLTMRVGAPQANERVGDDAFWVAYPTTSAITLGFPTGPLTLPNGQPNAHARTYYVSFAGNVSNGGSFVRRDFRRLKVTINPAAANSNGTQPLSSAPMTGILTANGVASTLGSVDLATLRVERGYTQLTNLADNWEGDEPYVCKVLNPQLGVILFSPYAFGQYVSGPMGREALVAKVDYNVYDWRILREEFRFPLGLTPQHQLAVGGLKVGGLDGPDGRPNPVITLLEDPDVNDLRQFNHQRADNFVLMDLDTGGVYCERDPTVDAYQGTPWVNVNKSTGLVTMVDINPGMEGTQSDILLPDGTIREVTVDSRAVRALYRTRNEFAVQVFKASSSYRVSDTLPGLAPGFFFVGNTTRIYFPVADIGQKVTLGVVNYRTSGGELRQLLDQDFVVKTATGEPAPFVDIATADPGAATFDSASYGYAVRNVKGSSVTVRTVWNPEAFRLTTNNAKNMSLLDIWGRGWRRSTNETFLQLGEPIR